MANWKVLKDGEFVNTIVADKAFAMIYAEMNGYTVEEIQEPEPEPDHEPTTEERVAALEDENAMLKAQITAQSDQMDFYEDCIVEMASIVYA